VNIDSKECPDEIIVEWQHSEWYEGIFSCGCLCMQYRVPSRHFIACGVFEDLAQKKVRLINRQKGSGTRILLDYHLKRLWIVEIKPVAIREIRPNEATDFTP